MTPVAVQETSSPNHDARPAGTVIDTLVLHYTGMPTGAEALARLCDAEAKVSAHYLVEEDGTVFALVPEERRAWHAGVSSWRGRDRVNDRSIGIEIVHPGHEWGYRRFPEAQMDAVTRLCQGLLRRHPIPARNVVGHSDIAPTRKQDPGEAFDWARLAAAGVGWMPPLALPPYTAVMSPNGEAVFDAPPCGGAGEPKARRGGALGGDLRDDSFAPPAPSVPPPAPLRVARPPTREGQTDTQRFAPAFGLAEYGYPCPTHGRWDADTRLNIIAFQRHFAPHRLDGVWDAHCAAALAWLLERARA